MEKSLGKQLAELLNSYSVENASNTPDWILADYLLGCLGVFEESTKKRDHWYGIAPEPGRPYAKADNS